VRRAPQYRAGGYGTSRPLHEAERKKMLQECAKKTKRRAEEEKGDKKRERKRKRQGGRTVVGDTARQQGGRPVREPNEGAPSLALAGCRPTQAPSPPSAVSISSIVPRPALPGTTGGERRTEGFFAVRHQVGEESGSQSAGRPFQAATRPHDVPARRSFGDPARSRSLISVLHCHQGFRNLSNRDHKRNERTSATLAANSQARRAEQCPNGEPDSARP